MIAMGEYLEDSEPHGEVLMRYGSHTGFAGLRGDVKDLHEEVREWLFADSRKGALTGLLSCFWASQEASVYVARKSN